MGMMLIKASQETTAGVLPDENLLSAAKRHGAHWRKVSVVLWIVQGLLALVFLFAGGVKLVVPLEVLAALTPLPALFMKFIGLAEFLGALGLILPGLLRIRPVLTPLAAAGLVIDMIGATVVTLATIGVAPALAPLVVGLLAGFVAYGRWRVVRQTARYGRSQGIAST